MTKICKNCYGKGFATVFIGEQWAMADFIGDKTYKIKDAMIVIKYCNCKKGKMLEKKSKLLK